MVGVPTGGTAPGYSGCTSTLARINSSQSNEWQAKFDGLPGWLNGFKGGDDLKWRFDVWAVGFFSGRLEGVRLGCGGGEHLQFKLGILRSKLPQPSQRPAAEGRVAGA